MARIPLLVVVAACAVAGCGGPTRRPRRDPEADPALAREDADAGEIVIRGELSRVARALRVRRRYVAAFEQTAPEDPDLDFSRQTSFVATLDEEAEIERRDSIKLFRASRRTGASGSSCTGATTWT